MLRITPHPGTDHNQLLLEGNLLQQWIEELRRALAHAGQDGAAVRLDLSGLRFVDAAGVRFLRECRKRGISLLGASPFVSTLLDPLPRRR